MDDALDVLAWRNDPLAVAMSKTPTPVNPKSHQTWFAEAISDPQRLLLVAEMGERKLGLVRFDQTLKGWMVSVNIAPNERGKGFGQTALQKSLEIFASMFGSARFLAEVKSGNEKSVEIFRRCGFMSLSEEDGWQLLVRQPD